MIIVVKDEQFMPKKATDMSIGYDLRTTKDFIIKPGERMLIGTGVWQYGEKHEWLDIRPRSGLALKQGITILNTPGTIDPDYTGEIGVILYSTNNVEVEFKAGDRIAQMVYMSYTDISYPEFKIKEDPAQYVLLLAENTARGGFGSTGKK